MQLVADRFLLAADGEVLDLGTGSRVTLLTSCAGSAAEQLRWASRCDRLYRLAHRALAPLVDYGFIGTTERFEAWRCGASWVGDPGAADEALHCLSVFCEAMGWSPPDRGAARVCQHGGRPVVLPDARCGYDAAASCACTVPLAMCALTRIERRAASAIATLLSDGPAGRPTIVAFWGSPGSGVDSTLDDIARSARLHGFVPLGVPVADRRVFELVRDRSLFLISRTKEEGWRGLVECTLATPRPHVLVFAGRTEIAGIPGVALERLTPEALTCAVRPNSWPPAASRRIQAAARRAHGLPGQFVSLLWGAAAAEVAPVGVGAAWIAAEQPSAYGQNQPETESNRSPEQTDCWPAPGELLALRRRMDRAIEQWRSGRHAAADRGVRQAAGALARRHDWTHAARGVVALASALLQRGRPRDAQALLDAAREYASRGGDDEALARTAVLAGVAWTDRGRLDEAESILHTALRAAQSQGDPTRVVPATLAFARCLFWRGSYAEATDLVTASEEAGVTGPESVRLAIAAARIAIGARDFAKSVGRAAEAVSLAGRLAEPSLVARAASASAFAHLALGDRANVERHVRAAVRASRAAHDPLCALKARLIGAESARRSGQTQMAVALLAHTRRLGSDLPATVRARCALLGDLLTDTTPDVVRRHVSATGLKALALFAPMPADTTHALQVAAEDVIDILQCCHSADADVGVLGQVCTRLRGRLNAAGVAVLAREGGTLASAGSRVEPSFAARVIDAGQAIAPHPRGERVEGGAPVRYGGETLGALVARWPMGTPHDLSRAAAVLTMAATAAAPAVAGARAARAVSHPTANELVGVSRELEEVRRAIERAAPAPFAVLIEGESGTGKELVARAIHRRGSRRDRSFCSLNCAALPDDLVEAELFGHARGAFTGAIADRPGVFEEAHSGTLFLDEIGELSPRAQAKVLRTIQDGELRRVGENVSRRIDVRIVSATNRDLRQEASAGRFRLDLLYRVDVIRITLPPLRERRDDIGLLVEHFWRQATERLGSRASLSVATVAALVRHDWPGNIRELQNVLAALAVRSPKRGVVPPTALPPCFDTPERADGWRLHDARRTFEDRFVRAALVRAGGQRSRAAAELGITRQGLTKLMARLGIGEARESP